MRGRVDSENEMYLVDNMHQHDQRPSSAPPDPHQFQFPVLSNQQQQQQHTNNNNNTNDEHLMRNAAAWKTNNQPVASPLYDPSSSSRQVWSNTKKSRPVMETNYHSKHFIFYRYQNKINN